MAAYVVFDSNTGQIIETHAVPSEMPDAREYLLATVEGQEEQELDVAIVDLESVRAEANYRTDPKTRELVESDSGTGVTLGFLSFAPAGGDQFLRHVKREYRR